MKTQKSNYFIYAKLPEETRKALPHVSIPKENYHITLKYLGAHTPGEVGKIQKTLPTLLEQHKDFTLKVPQYETFPHGKIYHADTNRPKRLLSLEQNLTKTLGRDKRYPNYHPHITLDYGTGGATPPKPKIPKFKINEIVLANADTRSTIQSYKLQKRTLLEQFSDWLQNA